MFSMRVRLLIFLVAFPSVVERSTAQRSQGGPNLRGHSFGLENFLYQRFDGADPIRITTPKRGRPTPQDRAKTYGLDNLSTQVYESSRIVPTPEKWRPVEPVAESSRVKENFLSKTEPATPPPEGVTERIRKRIMMKRRRKRPSNTIQTEEVTGNAILKPVRIPVFPQVPKVVVRTKLPEVPQRLVKPVTELDEELTQRDVTTEIEEITTTTTTTTTTTDKPSTINLKTFLKQQTETLSLSELLQTQNLSLADLLKGNKDASVILKARQTTTTTTSTVSRKTFNKPETPEPEFPKRFEVLEVTTSRPSYNRFHPKIPRIKPPEPSIPKPEDTPPREPDPLNRLNEMRLKLRNFQRKTSQTETSTREETTEPISRLTEAPVTKKTRVSFHSTNNPELSLILPVKPKPQPEIYKRPEKLTNWTNRLPPVKRLGQERIKPVEEKVPKPLKIPMVDEAAPGSLEEPEEFKTTELPLLEDARKPEPKDELIELLKSGQNAERLQKILNSRNMTLQELLENREKPPLQMDITTLFSIHHMRERSSPAPTLFESLPDFDSKPGEAYDEPYAEESAPTIARVELVPPIREPKLFNVDPNLLLDDLKMDPTNSGHSALWRLTEKSIYHGNSYGFGEVLAAEPEPKKPSVKTPELTNSDIILLETIRRNQETNRKYKLDFSDFVKEEEPPEAESIEKSYIPPAVKSAIIASGVVMGIALFVFIAIFAACGWKQRRIRLKGSALADSLSEPTTKSKRTLSPVSYPGKSYKKTIDFDDDSSESGASNTSSYLWSTLKNTFTSRTSTVKSRLEREEKMREDKMTLRGNESRRKVVSKSDDEDEERFPVKKLERGRNVISTSFNFKRTPSTCSVNHFNECVHGY